MKKQLSVGLPKEQQKWSYVFGNSSGTSIVIFEGKNRIAEVHYLEDAKKICNAHNASLGDEQKEQK